MKVSLKIITALSLLASATLGLSGSASAQANLIQNGNFANVSNYTHNYDGPVYGSAANWTTTNDVEFTAGEGTANGAPYAAVFNDQDEPAGNALSQSFATTAGDTYTVSYDFANYGASTAQTMNASVTGSGVLGSQSETLYGTGFGDASYNPYSFTFKANSGTTTLSFNDAGSTTVSTDGLVDNVAVNAVPEASTVVLFSMILGGLALFLRTRKQTGNVAL